VKKSLTVLGYPVHRSIFASRFLFLVLSQMALVNNRSLLSTSCKSMAFILKVLPNMRDGFYPHISIERASSVQISQKGNYGNFGNFGSYTSEVSASSKNSVISGRRGAYKTTQRPIGFFQTNLASVYIS
jgi:hypothetical protein